jgi:hypothetical protein
VDDHLGEEWGGRRATCRLSNGSGSSGSLGPKLVLVEGEKEKMGPETGEVVTCRTSSTTATDSTAAWLADTMTPVGEWEGRGPPSLNSPTRAVSRSGYR